jgi:hypothetical protein
VIEILITEGQAVDPLRHRVFDEVRTSQPASVGGDGPAVKLGPMKSEDKLVTLCAHKAVLLLGTISFWTKELCHEVTAFFYLL